MVNGGQSIQDTGWQRSPDQTLQDYFRQTQATQDDQESDPAGKGAAKSESPLEMLQSAHSRDQNGCTEENTFRVLIENYQDFDCYSMDTDQKIDELVEYGYAGTTAMRSRTPSGTGSGSSESSVDGPLPMVDLTGGLLDRTEKPPDLDKMVTPQADQEKAPIKETPPSSDKKKKTKKK